MQIVAKSENQTFQILQKFLNNSKTDLPPKKLEIAVLAIKENSATLESFGAVLLEICTLIGCSFPDKDLINLLFERYVLKYSDLNLWEFKLAFKMNLDREFSFEVVIDNKREFIDRKNHYNNFSGEFMTDVLNAFREVKFKTIQEIKQKEIDSRPRLPISETATDLNTLTRVLKDFEGGVLIFDTRKYDILSEKGIYTVQSEDKKKYVEKAKGIFEASKVTVRNVLELKKIDEVLQKYLQGDNKALIYDAKKLAYIDFLKLPENKIKVENYINEYNGNGTTTGTIEGEN